MYQGVTALPNVPGDVSVWAREALRSRGMVPQRGTVYFAAK
jgi:hypothetical protein